MVSYARLIPMLSEIERLLVKCGYPWQAENVRKLIDLQDTNEAEFVRLIQDGGMWGGSGAVWEVGPMGEDTVAFKKAMVQLAEEMEDVGLACKGSQFAACCFRNELGS